MCYRKTAYIQLFRKVCAEGDAHFAYKGNLKRNLLVGHYKAVNAVLGGKLVLVSAIDCKHLVNNAVTSVYCKGNGFVLLCACLVGGNRHALVFGHVDIVGNSQRRIHLVRAAYRVYRLNLDISVKARNARNKFAVCGDRGEVALGSDNLAVHKQIDSTAELCYTYFVVAFGYISRRDCSARLIVPIPVAYLQRLASVIQVRTGNKACIAEVCAVSTVAVAVCFEICKNSDIVVNKRHADL